MVLRETQQITVDEFEDFLELPENEDRLLELIDGEVVEKLPTQKHASIATEFIGAIFVWMSVQKKRPGYVLPEARYGKPEDRRNSRIPDVSYVTTEHGELVDKGAAPYMPDLAIEITSPGQTVLKLREKIAYYMANGTRLAWLVISKQRKVEVYRPNEEVLILDIDDELDGYDVLPGFKLPIVKLFA